MAVKGKQIAEKSPSSSSKRKRDDSDKSDKAKRRNPGVLQFFDVSADVDDDNEAEESDDDYFDDDFMDEVNTGKNEKCDDGKTPNHPFVPKEEELSDGELEMLIEERYKPGSQYVRYADDENKTRGPVEMDSLLHATNDPIIWRVKCTVGRERRTAFCLIQKFVDLQSLGNKLKIASAFSPDHIKGYIYIEAERECDVLEACKGLSTIYSSRISPVPKNEVANLFCVRETSIDILPGTWVRVKLGKYRGDVAQVVAFDDVRKSVVVKIIPRIDLQALGKKVAGGDTVEQTAIPVARLITSKDLEEFRPYIKLRRDRTGMVFETIGGLKLKDGYLFKKVSIESISYVDVVPSADELLKFKPYRKDASDDAEWLSHLYGEQRKKRLSECSKAPNKSSEGTSGAKSGKDFQLHDLVFFGPKDFGVIIGVDSDSFQIIKYDEVEGAELLNVELHEVKRSGIGKKFTTMDHQMKPISINDTVRALEGPFMGRQGVVKHICKGIIFIYDTNQLENGGYFCTKSKWCENISSNDASHESTGNAFDQDNIFGDKGFGGFGDSTSSPKSPQFSKKPWQEKENTHDFNSRRQGDRDDAFSVGQTLRIRVGPLKGHLCRVISIYRSGVTVKVDSQTKVLSVKREHLSEAGVKSNFMKLNNGFGTPGEASGVPAESNVWGSASLTTERSSWSDFSAPDFLDSSSNTPFEALATSNLEKDIDKGDDPWGSKTNFKKPADSWGNAIGSSSDLEKDKEEGGDPWRSKETSKKATDCWGNAAGFVEDPGKGKDEGDDPWGSKATTSQRATDNWGNAAGFGEGSGKGDDSWRSKESSKTPDSWGNATGTGGDLDKGKEGGDDPWGSKATTTKKDRYSWGNAAGFGENPGKDGGDDPWGSKGKAVADDGGWGKAAVVQNTDSWDKGKSVAGDDWGAVTQGVGNNGISSQEDSCGKATGSWMVKDGSNGNKTEWNQSAATGKSENDSWNKPKAFGADDGWNSQKGGDSDRGLDWNKGKVNEEASMDNQQDGWNKPRNFDRGRGSGGRRGGGGFRGGNRDQSGRGRSFGRGRSSDWNNESRQTITDFGNSSSSWNNEQSDSWKKNNSFGGDQGSTWGKSSLATDGNSNQGDGLDSKASIWKSEVADTGGNKSSGWASNGAGDAAGNKSSGWGSSSDGAGGNKSSGWASNGAGDAAGNKSSGWGGSGNRVVNAGENKSAGWGSVGSGAAEAGENKSSGWGSSSHAAADAGENKSSGWGSSSQEAANEGGNKSTGWGSSSQEAANEGGNKATGWGSTCINKSSGWGDSSNGVGNAGGNKSAGWGRAADAAGEKKPSGWGSSDHAAADTRADTGENKSSGWGSTGRDKSSGWGSGSNWNAQKDSCVSQSSDWNQGAETTNNWRGGKSFRGGRTSGWSSRGSDNDDAGGSSQFSNRGRGFGRGGSNRGGFSNRDDSGAGESADFSGKGRGFGRGGFGSRGRGGRGRRDQTGDWDRGRSHGDSQSFGGWNKGANDGTGDQVGGWGNQVSGTDGTSSGVGWAGKSTESWSQSNAGGWNRGKPQDNNQSFGGSKAANDDANDKVGGWGNQGTNKSESWGGKKSENWNQSNAGNWGNQGTNKNEGWGCKQTENLNQSQAGKWSKGGNDDGRDQVGGWSNQVPGSRGTSGSEGWSSKKNESWNQPKAADETEPAGWNSRKGEASGSGGAQAESAWGKPAVSSWGVDKGGKGGW